MKGHHIPVTPWHDYGYQEYQVGENRTFTFQSNQTLKVLIYQSPEKVCIFLVKTCLDLPEIVKEYFIYL